MIENTRFRMLCSCIFLFILLTSIIVATISAPDYTIDNNKVYIDDSRIYASATPHTLQGSGWVIFNFTSKEYAGFVDIGLGFDTTELIPKEIQSYSPHLAEREMSYTCYGDYFNYTSNHAWCYNYYSNTSTYELLFNHSFESGNLGEKTIYWNETYWEEWVEFDTSFSSVNHEYRGMNKWWFKQNVNLNQNQEYVFRIYMENINGLHSSTKKYWFVFKPSSETISQAISNNHLYALDPWITGVEPTAYWKFESDGTDYSRHGHTMNEEGTITYTPGKLGNAVVIKNGVGIVNLVNVTRNISLTFGTGDFTIVYWYNSTNTSGSGLIDNSASLTTGYGIHNTDDHIFVVESADTGIKYNGLANNIWHRIVYSRITGVLKMYVDGVEVDSGNIANNFNTYGPTYCFRVGASGGEYMFDDMALYKGYGWISTDVTTDWNGGIGLELDADILVPNVTINFPLNESYNYDTIVFNITAVDGEGVDSCYYSLDNFKTNISLTNYSTSQNYWIATNYSMLSGTHHVNFTCNDTTNNINRSEGVTIYIESVINMSIVNPLNISYNTNVSELDYTISDGFVETESCWYSRNLGNVNSTFVNAGENFTDVTSVEGTNNWIVYCNKTTVAGGFINSTNLSFFKDTIFPVINITSPNGALTTSTPYVNISVADTNLDFCLYNVTLQTSLGVEIISSRIIPDCSNITMPVIADGEYYFFLQTNDEVGNVNVSNSSFTITTSTTSSSSTGSGTTIIVGMTNETAWSIMTTTGAEKYEIYAIRNSIRTFQLLLENLGESQRIISFQCVDVDGNMCDYVSFEHQTFTLPVTKDIQHRTSFTIEFPEDIRESVQLFNIVAKDDLGIEASLTVNVIIPGPVLKVGLNLFSTKIIFGLHINGFLLFLIIAAMLIAFNYIIFLNKSYKKYSYVGLIISIIVSLTIITII